VDFHFELRNVLMVGLPTLLVLPLAAIPALTQLLRKPPAASLRSHRIG
jgi:hypothetical protein